MKIRAGTTSIWTAVAERSGDTAFERSMIWKMRWRPARAKAVCPDSESGFPQPSQTRPVSV